MKLGSVMFVLSLGAFTTAADAAESKLKLPLGLQESALLSFLTTSPFAARRLGF